MTGLKQKFKTIYISFIPKQYPHIMMTEA